MSSIVFEMSELDVSSDLCSEALLILALDKEKRSRYAIKQIAEHSVKCDEAIIFAYNKDIDDTLELVRSIVNNNITVIAGFPKTQNEFIEQMKQCDCLCTAKKIIIDVSSLITPSLFLLLRKIYIKNQKAQIYAINTVPFDYSFSESPFLSYKSYFGDLKMEEIIGFGATARRGQQKHLFIFAGFEGALALKVEEDTEYSRLIFVNALPSYCQKYKDISVINNYQLLSSKYCKRLNVPAINPFEVYNLLDQHITEDDWVSIAPLCTKPISLGICMYALHRKNVRIVYPFSEQYESDRSHDVYKSYIYRIPLC